MKELNKFNYLSNGAHQIVETIKGYKLMTKIIAELCQNHNGDLKILDEMVSAAADAGADFVKIQSMLSKDLTHRKKFDDGIIDKEGQILTIKRPYKNEYERLKKLDLDDQAHFNFLDMCKKYKVNQ